MPGSLRILRTGVCWGCRRSLAGQTGRAAHQSWSSRRTPPIHVIHRRRRNRQKRRQRSSLLLGGRNSQIKHQDNFKKRINSRTDPWQNWCFRKMNDHLVHTTPNHHPPKWIVLPETFLPINLAAKWLVRLSRTVRPPNSNLCPLFCLFLVYA